MNMNVTNLIICSNSCNELKSLNLNEYRYLKSIEIGDDCFEKVELFNIDGLNELNELKIGDNSFTQQRDGNNQSRSFHLLNCAKLKSVDIGRYSFSDYSGNFELVNLPSLTTIKIGSIETDYSDSNNKGRSSNFFWSSFVVEGIKDIVIAVE